MWTQHGEGSVLISCPAWVRSKSPGSRPPISSPWSEPSKRGERGISRSGLSRQQDKFFATQSLTATQSATRPWQFDRGISSRPLKSNHARIDARELPNLLPQIEVYQGTHVTRLALKLMALSFVRTSELIGAKWTEFDLEAARWNIPADRMKMRSPIVPLASQSFEVLDTLHVLTGHTEWLFPGKRNASKQMSNNTILKALERMGYKGTMTGHGFRGLASIILHERGCVHEHIEIQLAHAPRNAVSAAYNHALYLEPRAKMMQEWADFLEQTQRGAKVLPFRESIAEKLGVVSYCSQKPNESLGLNLHT
jgi:integrase